MEIMTATCRICAQEHKTVVCSDDSRHNFKQILTFLTFKSASVQVEPTDNLPQTICHLCRQELLRTYRFLNQIEQSAQFFNLNRPVLKKTITRECVADRVPNVIFPVNNDIQSFQPKPVCKFEAEEIIVKQEAVDFQFCDTNYNVREENELNSESDWRKNCDNEYEEGSSSLIEHHFQFVDVRDDISGKHSCKVETIEGEEIADDFQHTSSELQTFTMNSTGNLLPAKSRIAYEKTYVEFEKWRKKNNISNISEEAMLDFFRLQMTKYKVASVISIYTKLKSCLSIYCSVDISKYNRLQTLLKQWSKGNVPKTNILEIDDIHRFISEADDRMYLVMKVILIMGYSGACKRDQLTYITTDDIKYTEDRIIVSVTDRKTNTRNEFEIKERSWMDLIKHYAALRPKTLPHKRFFLTYRNGRCLYKTIGVNSMGKVCKEIASFLRLPDPESYTGRCFRKSSTAQASKTDVWSARRRHRKSKVDECREEILQKRIKTA